MYFINSFFKDVSLTVAIFKGLGFSLELHPDKLRFVGVYEK